MIHKSKIDIITIRFYKLLALLLKHGMIVLGKYRESFQLLLPTGIT